MSPRRDRPRDRDRDELEDRLDELEETLTELRRELRADGRRRPPRPPSLGDLLRFTERYTIPALIAALEATIRSLELLRRTLRLADPARAAREETDDARRRLDRASEEAAGQFAGALSELRRALSEADLPENPESRRLLQDAQDLAGEIEGRIRDAERDVRRQRDRERDADREARRGVDRDRGESVGAGSRDRGGRERGGGRGVVIDVTEEGADDGATAESDETDETDETDDAPGVDVDAELESIKDELERRSKRAGEADPDGADGGDEDGAGSDDRSSRP